MEGALPLLVEPAATSNLRSISSIGHVLAGILARMGSLYGLTSLKTLFSKVCTPPLCLTTSNSTSS